MKKILLLLSIAFSVASLHAQKYTEETLRTELDSMAVKQPGLKNQLQLNVSNLPLTDLLSSVGMESELNISVSPELKNTITYNFFDAQVIDMLVFVYLNFEVEYDFIGSIISVRKRDQAPIVPVVIPEREVDVKYNSANKFLSMNLRNDTLWKVTEKITKLSNENFVLAPDVRNKPVNAYFLNRPFDEVIKLLGEANDLDIQINENHVAISKGIQEVGPTNNNPRGRNNPRKSQQSDNLTITKNEVGTIDVFARDAPIDDLIAEAAIETDVQYLIYSDLKGNINLDVQDVRFDELIGMVLNGSPYSSFIENEVYLIGENKSESIRKSEIVRLENRTIESVLTAIPQDLTTDVEVKEFPELNGLILMGSEVKLNNLKEFIRSIDVVVPMVQLDVIIMYSERGSTVNTGITAGFSEQPVATEGTVFPGLDVTLGFESINNLIDAINGFGVFNLGKVTENFYLSLQALESNNIVKIESTPKISVLNGHDAKILIGETTYYQQERVSVQNSAINSGVITNQEWVAINADLTVDVKPFVSSDEHVTLTIGVTQNDFNGRVSKNAPPNVINRNFESMVRVKNGEMILLGGLDTKQKSDSGSGTPILSRIPILKWFFSGRNKSKRKTKLHILLRPVISY